MSGVTHPSRTIPKTKLAPAERAARGVEHAIVQVRDRLDQIDRAGARHRSQRRTTAPTSSRSRSHRTVRQGRRAAAAQAPRGRDRAAWLTRPRPGEPHASSYDYRRKCAESSFGCFKVGPEENALTLAFWLGRQSRSDKAPPARWGEPPSRASIDPIDCARVEQLVQPVSLPYPRHRRSAIIRT